jgi:hypothetical protein
MASKYLSSLLRKHSLCSQCNASLSEEKVLNEYNNHQIKKLMRDITTVISIFDKRFSLKLADIAEKVMLVDNSFFYFDNFWSTLNGSSSKKFPFFVADTNLL